MNFQVSSSSIYATEPPSPPFVTTATCVEGKPSKSISSGCPDVHDTVATAVVCCCQWFTKGSRFSVWSSQQVLS